MMYVTSLSAFMPATVTSAPLPPSRLIRSFDDHGTIRVAWPSSTDLVLFPSLSLGGKTLRLAAPGLPLSQDVRLRYKVPGDRTSNNHFPRRSLNSVHHLTHSLQLPGQIRWRNTFANRVHSFSVALPHSLYRTQQPLMPSCPETAGMLNDHRYYRLD